jgi:hypothetical protein
MCVAPGRALAGEQQGHDAAVVCHGAEDAGGAAPRRTVCGGLAWHIATLHMWSQTLVLPPHLDVDIQQDHAKTSQSPWATDSVGFS